MSGENIDGMIASFKKAANRLFQRFKDNRFKGNADDNCHLLVSLYNFISMKTRGFENKLQLQETIRSDI